MGPAEGVELLLICTPLCALIGRQILLRVIARHVGGGVEAHGILAVAVGMDVLRVAVFQRPLAGLLPAPGGQHQAEGAGVAVGDPRELRPVPDGVLERGVRPGLLDQPGNGALEQRRAVLRAVHRLGQLAIGGRGGGFCRRKGQPRGLGHGVVHLAGQLRAPFAVFVHQCAGVGDQRGGVLRAIALQIGAHQLSGLRVQPGEPVGVVTPRLRRQPHPRPPLPPQAPAGPAPVAPGHRCGGCPPGQSRPFPGTCPWRRTPAGRRRS